KESAGWHEQRVRQIRSRLIFDALQEVQVDENHGQFEDEVLALMDQDVDRLVFKAVHRNIDALRNKTDRSKP
ncbi:MAG TPA: hypothetical protein VGZ22_25300, partial [Isosphaeraceae bacterium]|nr:hypothetical protein [Isosphaeraceae bacterium]